MWQLRVRRPEADTEQWRLLSAAEDAMSFAEVVSGWKSDERFRGYWSSILRSVPFGSYAWECPPLTATGASRSFECVFVSSPALASLRPEPRAFAGHFRREARVATFPNLGGDAVLVAPAPADADSEFTHLARFAAAATPEHANTFWQAVGEAVARRVGSKPVWLSTAGLGVGWLHVRLDDRPKYYRHLPYARSPAG